MKLLLLIAGIFFISTTYSQIIFSEDFDGITGPTAGGAGTYTFPSGWLLRNVDNRVPAASVAYVNEAWERREDFASNVSDSCAFSTSWYSPAGIADDWMWTPAIAILPNSQLSWNAITYDATYRDGYEVRIMTQSSTPSGPTGGAGVLGNQVSNSTVLYNTAAESTTWVTRNVDLSSYAGETVWIAWRNNSTDKFILLIDDIIVEVLTDFDAEVTSVEEYEYTQSPINQASYLLGGTISNMGEMEMTDVALNVDIYNSAEVNVFSSASTPANLTVGSSSIINLGNFVPTVVDTYTLVYYTSSFETDQNTSNDSITTTIIVTDSIYARDNGIPFTTLGIGAGNGGFIGNQFQVLEADTLTSVTMSFGRGYVGRQYAAVIWDMDGGIPNAIIGGTDTLLYPSDDAIIVNIPLQNLTILQPGEYVITAIEFDSTLALVNTLETFTPGKTWINWPTSPLGGWGNAEDFGAQFSRPFYLRANFGSLCEAIATEQDIFICFGDTYEINGNVYDETGVYVDIFNSGVCDSTVTTNLTIYDEINPIAIQSVDNLSVQTNPVPSATYQWINCVNNQDIADATSNSYTIIENGDYAVVVTLNGCSDTSNCVTMELSNIELIENLTFNIYPNPTTDKVTILSSSSGKFELLNQAGMRVKSFELESNVIKIISIQELEAGIYLIRKLNSNEARKLIIQ